MAKDRRKEARQHDEGARALPEEGAAADGAQAEGAAAPGSQAAAEAEAQGAACMAKVEVIELGPDKDARDAELHRGLMRAARGGWVLVQVDPVEHVKVRVEGGPNRDVAVRRTYWRRGPA